jgi:uncharacterized membrane protein HdeD (DUF308 family)
MITDPQADERSIEQAPRPIRVRPGLALGLGIVLVILGAIAVALPNVATLAAEVLIGWLFILSGLVYAYSVISLRGVWRIASATLISALSLATGVLLLFYPLHGVLTLTMVMAAYFAAAGVLRLVHAAQHRHLRGWLWGLVSGLAGIGIAVLVFLGWPDTAVWALGLLLGIDLLFSGWALIMLYGALRQRPDDRAPPAVP